MSIAQTMPLVDKLIKARIPKQTATELVDFIEKTNHSDLKQDVEIVKRDIHWLKWIVGLGLSIGFTITFTIMIYLHSDLKSDMNQRIDKLDTRMDALNSRMSKIDSRMSKIESKLDLLLKK